MKFTVKGQGVFFSLRTILLQRFLKHLNGYCLSLVRELAPEQCMTTARA